MSTRIISLTEENLEEHDLFCQKSRFKDEGYQNKLKWIKDRFKEGLKMKLLMVNEGKKKLISRGMIEYVPGEFNWRGIDAKGWMVIHCIWVIGRNKKKGYGSRLIKKVIEDAKDMHGVAVVASKNGHWLPKPELFIKRGFEKVDELPPVYELFVKRNSDDVPLPKFNALMPEEAVKEEYGEGVTMVISHQCPYACGDMVKRLSEVAERAKIPIRKKLITSAKEAQTNGIHPYGTSCFLLNGKVLTYKYELEKDIVKKFIEHGVKV